MNILPISTYSNHHQPTEDVLKLAEDIPSIHSSKYVTWKVDFKDSVFDLLEDAFQRGIKYKQLNP